MGADNCPQLTNITMGGCVELTDEAVMRVAKRCCRLRVLNLGHNFCWGGICEKLTDAAIMCVAEHCKHLRELDICKAGRRSLNWKFSDAGIIRIAQCCTELTRLSVDSSATLTEASLNEVRRLLPS